jgi:antitoxin (DNA-binding transcriptional repressor) of toxin-antitoxin stability system
MEVDMRVSIAKAQDALRELVSKAEAGDEIILTRDDGKPAVRLVPVPDTMPAADQTTQVVADQRRRLMLELQAQAVKTLRPGPSAARSQDELYDSDGLPI